MSRCKSHFYTSDDPPRFGTDLIAVCGAVVGKAESLLWTTGEVAYNAHVKVSCYDCNNRTFREQEYFAIITDGQQAMDEERGREAQH